MNMETSLKPSVGRIVHYQSHGSADGTYPSVCRAAIVTEVPETWDAQSERDMPVGLCVLNPTGIFLNTGILHHVPTEVQGDPDCPAKASHGDPFRYCQCGWIEASPKGGTWHWPERV
jgi:hypothetical protein